MKEYFAIIGQRSSDPSEYKMLGTGFFIDNKGNFLTAGHVFRDHQASINNFYICFPNADEKVKLIPIKKFKILSRKLYLDNERLHQLPRPRKVYQCGPEYKDVAVGNVELQYTPFYQYRKKRPYEWEKLKMPCHNINLVLCSDKKFSLVDNLLNSSFIEFHNRDLVIKERLSLARMPFLDDEMIFESIDKYNNCIEVYGEGVRGNSGAPVLLSNGKVIGIYVAGAKFNNLNAVHLSRYVFKKARKLMRDKKNNTKL
jgi:hypothetical protein